MTLVKTSRAVIVLSIVILLVILSSLMINSLSTDEAYASSKKVGIYVVDKITKYDVKLKMSYNKNGLLNKITNSGKLVEKITYKKNKPISHKIVKNSITRNIKFYYKKNKLVKAIEDSGALIKNKIVYTTRKNGILSRARVKCSGSTLITYKYDKQGRITSSYKDELIKYDENGYVNQILNGSYEINYINTYNEGRLIKTVLAGTGKYTPYFTYKVKYKRISVPSSKAKTVKKQQYNILLKNLYMDDIYIKNGYLY